MSLLHELKGIRAVDQHAHNVRHPDHALPFAAAFTEATDPKVWEQQAPHGLFYRRSLKQLAQLFGVEPEEFENYRADQPLQELASRCIEAAKLSHLVLDDGLSPNEVLPWRWHQQFVPTKRLLRLEHLAETLLAERFDFNTFEERFRETLAQPAEEVVGFKCIAAYRGGLRLPFVSRVQARRSYDPLAGRLQRSDFYHYLIHIGLQAAQNLKLPVQFHTGFGDPDLALEESNPLLLRPLIETYSCPFVILHTGYPYFREAGFLSSVYHNAWVDFGLAVPFLSYRGMKSAVSGLLELAPLNKVLYSSDASLVPELFYLGALNARRVLADVLGDGVSDGDLTANEALQAGSWILRENALALYRLAG